MPLRNPRTDTYNDPTTTKGGHERDDASISAIPTPSTVERPNAVTPMSRAPDQRAMIAMEKIRISTPSIRKPAEKKAALGLPNKLAISPKMNPTPRCVKPHRIEKIPAANLPRGPEVVRIPNQHPERFVLPQPAIRAFLKLFLYRVGRSG